MTPLHTILSELLGVLRAIHWNSWTEHWKTSGPNFYGTHLLLQRIYSGDGGGPSLENETDGLGERIVALYGPSGVDTVAIQEQTLRYLKSIAGQDPIQGALTLELVAMRLGSKAASLTTKLPPQYSVNLDNYLRSLVDERSTVIYLLQQRLGIHPNANEFGAPEPAQSSNATNAVLGFLILGGIAYGVYTVTQQVMQPAPQLTGR